MEWRETHLSGLYNRSNPRDKKLKKTHIILDFHGKVRVL